MRRRRSGGSCRRRVTKYQVKAQSGEGGTRGSARGSSAVEAVAGIGEMVIQELAKLQAEHGD